jgi:hypothetical protein
MKNYKNKIIQIILIPGVMAGSIHAESLDVTIKGEMKDKVTIERVAPTPDVALKDAIPFSRLGQTDFILTEEIDYLDEERQVALMDVHSPKTFQPSMIEFPKPPYSVPPRRIR